MKKQTDISQSDRQFISLEDDDFCPYEENLILKRMRLDYLVHYFRSTIKEI